MNKNNFTQFKEKEQHLLQMNNKMDERNKALQEQMKDILNKERNFDDFNNLDVNFSGIEDGFENFEDKEAQEINKKYGPKFGK